MKFFSILFLFCLLACQTSKPIKKNERWYQERWCARHGGRVEVKMPDNTRCDCLTRDYAIEFDFASKRFEGIGQAIHYAELTGKKAGLVLICKKPSDRAKASSARKLLQKIRKKYFIRLWTIGC